MQDSKHVCLLFPLEGRTPGDEHCKACVTVQNASIGFREGSLSLLVRQDSPILASFMTQTSEV